MFNERIVELKKSLGNIPGAFSLVWEADKKTTLLLGIYTGIQAMLPVLQAYTGKLIIDGVMQGLSQNLATEQALRLIGPYLAIEFALFATGSLITHARRLSEQILEQRAGHSITEKIIKKALTLEMRYFEDAQFYDQMQKARRESEYRAMAVIGNSLSLAQNIMTLFSFIFILIAMSPIIAVILFTATIPSFAVQTRYGKLKFRLQSWRAPESRMMNYLEQVLTLDSTIKEIKLFRLGKELLSRFNSMFDKIFYEDLHLAKRRLRFSYLWGLVSTLSFYACYAWIIYLTVQRKITLGDMTLYLGAVRLSQGSFQGILDNIAKLYENGLFLENLFSFFSIEAPTQTTNGFPKNLFTESTGIEFHNVTYQYASGTHPAISNVSFRIETGERFAIVGENGSGKTTLIKLLTGLYKPTDGAITLDGKNLNDFEPDELHARMGVIFQDYVKYQLTFRENIGFGNVEQVNDSGKINTAIERSGTESIVADLPDGLDSVLGNQFKGGRELSVGQWQKVALGRAFMKDSDVLILDEPTSALDAEREFEIFQRFQDLSYGKTVILISHRFSTVRTADRIVVMDRGKILELGTHDELIKLNGKYARLFELQARGYR